MWGEFCCCTLLYILMCLILVFPPDEIAGMGLTVENILGSWLGSDMTAFVQYHQRRSAATLFIQSLYIPGYFLMLYQGRPMLWEWLISFHSKGSVSVIAFSMAPVITTLCIVAYWRQNSWRNHPISKNLLAYANLPEPVDPDAWLGVATEINVQYRRVDKLSTRISSTVQIVATDSWLIKVSSCTVRAMPLEDALLVLEGALSSALTNPQRARAAGTNPQTLRLRARSISKKIPDISFRLSSNLWSELERKLVNPVVNTGQVVVQASLSDQFLQEFLDTVNKNPPMSSSLLTEEVTESCIGCMAHPANVKLDRRCQRLEVVGAAVGSCTHCSCRPMWCVTCMSHWFAARQDQQHPETWLSSRAPCPTCRSPFCLLDVRIIS